MYSRYHFFEAANGGTILFGGVPIYIYDKIGLHSNRPVPWNRTGTAGTAPVPSWNRCQMGQVQVPKTGTVSRVGTSNGSMLFPSCPEDLYQLKLGLNPSR